VNGTETPIMAPNGSCSTSSASLPTVEIAGRVAIVLWWTPESGTTLSLIRDTEEMLGTHRSTGQSQ
jgi:hypothetical protein